MEENTLTLERTQAVLQEYGDRLRDIYRQRLADEGANASNTLTNGVTVIVERDGDAVEVSLSLEYYWKFIENGSAPAGRYKQHWPPYDAILEWVRVKPVIPEERNGRVPTEEQLAYLIQRKIGTKGIEPKDYLKRSVEDVNREFEGKLEEALSEDLERHINWVFTSGFGQ